MTKIFKPTGSELVEQPRMKEPVKPTSRGPILIGRDRRLDYYRNYLKEYNAHLASLTRYTINPSDWTQGEEIKEGEFEVVRKCKAIDRDREGVSYDFNEFPIQDECPDCYLLAIPKRKDMGQDNLRWEQEIWDAARAHNYMEGTIMGVGNGYKWRTLREWLNSKVAKNI